MGVVIEISKQRLEIVEIEVPRRLEKSVYVVYVWCNIENKLKEIKAF